MPRATNAPASQRRRKRMLLAAKGYRGCAARNSGTPRTPSGTPDLQLRHRKDKKADYRALWTQRINAACRAQGITYSRFIAALKKANIALDRKILSDLATHDPKAFSAVLAATK